MGLRRLAAVSAIALSLSGLAAFAASQAGAISPLPGRMFGLADVAGSRGDLFRTTTSNTWFRLTAGLSAPESVSASPDGRFAVICATNRPWGIYRVYRVGAGGGPLKNLSGRPRACGQTVSPNGRKVAYVSDTGGSARLRVVRSNGGRSRTLYRFCNGCLYNPVWAGKRIYFERRVRRNPAADLEIYSIRAKDGRGLKRHTDDTGAPVDYFLNDVSADGRKLLVTVRYPLAATSILSILSPNGSIRLELATATGVQALGDASFSPDGTEIAFLRRDTDPGPYQMWTGPARTGVWFAGFPAPAVSTTGLYSIDWVRR